MNRPRLFAEFPAGLAAVSLRLQGGAHCRPPISRCGNKAGYSQTILGVLGLHSGQGAAAYWWAEADPDVAALLRIYPDPDALRAVAAIIRGWAGEEPRALWERLRAERRARAAEAAGTVGEVAGSTVSEAWGATGQYCGPDRGGQCGSHPPGWVGSITISGLADRADRLAEVAEFAFLHQGSFQYKGPDAGIGRPEGMVEGYRFRPALASLGDSFPRLAEYAMIASSNRLICVGGPDLLNTGKGGTTHGGAAFSTPPEQVAAGMAGVAAYRGWPPVRVSPRIPTAAEVAAAIGTPGDLEGCIIYMDPPYAGTTGYTADLSRAEVVAHALDFASLGATVAISEAEAIPDLVRSGWHSVEITGGRLGQKRTFSKQQQEIITMNRPAEYVVPVQISIYRTPAHQELT